MTQEHGQGQADNLKARDHIPSYEQSGVAMTCRTFDEYMKMFALCEEDLIEGPILDVAAGASSFVAEASKLGMTAVAADPLYQLNPDVLSHRGLEEIEESTAKLDRLKEYFDWSYYGSIERHQANRMRSLEMFIEDYRYDSRSGRYIAAVLPELPFADNHFRYVLCSHFLFLYGDQFGADFHLLAMRELLRVCMSGGHILIYPIKTLRWADYDGLPGLVEQLRLEGARVAFIPSRLPFIPGSTEVMSIGKR